MKKLLAITILTAAWNFSSGQSRYFQLEKGSTLTYAYGSELYGGTYDDTRIKVTILSATKMINGKEYLVSETSTGKDDSYSLSATSYLRISSDGFILAKLDEDGAEYTVMQSSPEVGDAWTSRNGAYESTTRVTDLDGTIQTANGTYQNCLVLEQTSEGNPTMHSYFKKDIGLVATTITANGSEKVFFHLVDK
ncbi:MAG: hypothetical protein WA960_05085 [Tunicatimonas sp.]